MTQLVAAAVPETAAAIRTRRSRPGWALALDALIGLLPRGRRLPARSTHPPSRRATTMTRYRIDIHPQRHGLSRELG